MRKEAFTLAAADWKVASEETKAPYIEKAEKDKQRFERQKQELKKKGYYMFDDGTKSIDPENKALVQIKQKRKMVDQRQLAPDDEIMPKVKEYKIPDIEDVLRRQKIMFKQRDDRQT